MCQNSACRHHGRQRTIWAIIYAKARFHIDSGRFTLYGAKLIGNTFEAELDRVVDKVVAEDIARRPLMSAETPNVRRSDTMAATIDKEYASCAKTIVELLKKE